MVTQTSHDSTQAADQRPPATASQPPVAPPGASEYFPHGQAPAQPHFGDRASAQPQPHYHEQPPVQPQPQPHYHEQPSVQPQPHYSDQPQPHFADQQPAQPPYGTRPPVQPHYDAPGVSRDHVAAALLAIFLGCFGVHKFYLGYSTQGFTMLALSLVGGLFSFGLAAGVVWVISLIEGVIYLTKSQSEFERTYVYGRREWF